jgi:hypothetical protein
MTENHTEQPTICRSSAIMTVYPKQLDRRSVRYAMMLFNGGHIIYGFSYVYQPVLLLPYYDAVP